MMRSLIIKDKLSWMHTFLNVNCDAYILGSSLKTCYDVFYGTRFSDIERQLIIYEPKH